MIFFWIQSPMMLIDSSYVEVGQWLWAYWLSLYIWPSTWAIFWHTLLNKEDIMKKNRSSPSEPLIPYQHTLLECNFGCRVLIWGTKTQNHYIIQLIIVKISWPCLNGGAFFYRPNLVVWWPTFRCCMLTGQKAFCWPTLWYLSSLTDLDFTYIIHVFQKRIFLAQKLFFYRLLIIRSYFSTDF